MEQETKKGKILPIVKTIKINAATFDIRKSDRIVETEPEDKHKVFQSAEVTIWQERRGIRRYYLFHKNEIDQ